MPKTCGRQQLSPASPVTEFEVHMAMDGGVHNDIAIASSTPTARTTATFDIALTRRRRMMEQWRETSLRCRL